MEPEVAAALPIAVEQVLDGPRRPRHRHFHRRVHLAGVMVICSAVG
jgi:hypothetical protein